MAATASISPSWSSTNYRPRDPCAILMATWDPSGQRALFSDTIDRPTPIASTQRLESYPPARCADDQKTNAGQLIDSRVLAPLPGLYTNDQPLESGSVSTHRLTQMELLSLHQQRYGIYESTPKIWIDTVTRMDVYNARIYDAIDEPDLVLPIAIRAVPVWRRPLARPKPANAVLPNTTNASTRPWPKKSSALIYYDHLPLRQRSFYPRSIRGFMYLCLLINPMRLSLHRHLEKPLAALQLRPRPAPGNTPLSRRRILGRRMTTQRVSTTQRVPWSSRIRRRRRTISRISPTATTTCCHRYAIMV